MDSVQGLDPSRRCAHHNEQGRCVSQSMVGENLCPAHSDSAAAASLRERMVVRQTRGEVDRVGAQGQNYGSPRVFPSPESGGGGSEPRIAENQGARRGNGKRSFAADEVHKMLFRGDITTGEGLIRLSERLMREFAAGKLEPRRFEIMMRAVRLMAALRRQFPAPPIDEPTDQVQESSGQAIVVDADRRPAAERAEELKHDQPEPADASRRAIRSGRVSVEPEPSRRAGESVRPGDYKAKRRGEKSKRTGVLAANRGESYRPRVHSARRLRFPPPRRSENRDAD